MKHYAIANYRARRTMRATGGFSLIELLIGSAVFVVVLLAIYIMLDTSRANYAMGAAKSDVQENVRVVLESMARELRMAGYAPLDSPHVDCPTVPLDQPCGVTALTSSSVTFQADLDGNNLTDKVIYTFFPPADPTRPCDPLDAATVGRIARGVQSWTAGAWSPATPTVYDIAQCMTDVTMIYYDSLGNTPATPPNARRINISITGVENARGTSSRSYTVTTDVRLRNL